MCARTEGGCLTGSPVLLLQKVEVLRVLRYPTAACAADMARPSGGAGGGTRQVVEGWVLPSVE